MARVTDRGLRQFDQCIKMAIYEHGYVEAT